MTCGFRWAGELVSVLPCSLALLSGAGTAAAQSTAQSPDRPFEILDNSFLVEEAFNQERGVFQNISIVTRSEDGTWEANFTQEWPVGSERHQLSYTVPFARAEDATGFGDVHLNYRYQALRETRTRPALAPRLSVILPTGSERKGLGDGVLGWQLNLPFSKQFRDLYLHWNAGLTYLPNVNVAASPGDGAEQDGRQRVSLMTPNVAASAVWRIRSMLNGLLEATAEFREISDAGASTARETALTLSPGVRGGWNFRDHQLILGLAVPLTMQEGKDEVAVLGYLSYELPFQR